MSEIKTLEKLREYAAHNCRVKGWKDDLRALADAIEAEIRRDYMRLPCDASGTPIRVGDKLECHANGYDGAFIVFAIGNDVVVGNYDIEWIARNPSSWFHVASFCTHVKPRTLEDVLQDFAIGVCEEDGFSEEHVRCCADEIRAMFGEVDHG